MLPLILPLINQIFCIITYNETFSQQYNFQEHKWKMYLEIDDDSDTDTDTDEINGEADDICVSTCVKHVMFLSKFPPYDIFKIIKVCKICKYSIK